MKPKKRSQALLGVTRSKAKMFEYAVPAEDHIEVAHDPSRLFPLTIGILGDVCARINSIGLEQSVTDLREDLHFSAIFFDSYLQSKLNNDLDHYLLLLASASYYLCDLPGSSQVLCNILGDAWRDLGGEGLESLLHWILQGRTDRWFVGITGPFGYYINNISAKTVAFLNTGIGFSEVEALAKDMRRQAYENGSPRQLLLADIICAALKKKQINSSWYCLPQYSAIPVDKWREVLQGQRFPREFWPSQHLLGMHGVYKGISAVVQMPTSAGKTKATEIIIRSAFLSARAEMAVVIAPFRALCHEIKNSLTVAFAGEPIVVDEVSDVIQVDFDLNDFCRSPTVLILTPEKLLYMLRHSPEVGTKIGLLIYDEGHQFDSGFRGVTYELLLTSLNSLVPQGAQKVLISAVISNAESVGAWVNGEGSEVISGTTLSSNQRTVAFTSWLDQRGRLEFVDPQEPEEKEFFVPRILERVALQSIGREQVTRFFPDRSNGQSIALFLAIKLAMNGAVAIFCGTKDTAANICNQAVEVYRRGFTLPSPAAFSDNEEVARLSFLHEQHFGVNSPITVSSRLGIYAHHANTPHGLRLAIEHAMKESLVKVVVCTSTLAQGVNLPIRYLIVTTVYQGADRIKVRDFHNLIGRAGRSGMHTEGSIIFADPDVYDERDKGRKEQWRWETFKNLLDVSKSEPCASSILNIVLPLRDSLDRPVTTTIDWVAYVRLYVEESDRLDKVPEYFYSLLNKREKLYLKPDLISSQLRKKIEVLSAIESYLMAHSDGSEESLNFDVVRSLAQETFAYHLANTPQRDQIVEIFQLLALNIAKNVKEPKSLSSYGRTLYGVRQTLRIKQWLLEHESDLLVAETSDETLRSIWKLLCINISNSTFRRIDNHEQLLEVAAAWIQGDSYSILFDRIEELNIKIIWGSQRRKIKVEQVVGLCENALGYDATLVIGALILLLEEHMSGDVQPHIRKLQRLQKQLKYGLSSSLSICLFEMGLSDRVVSQAVAPIIEGCRPTRKSITMKLKEMNHDIWPVIYNFPKYYQERFQELVQV